jgi:hypothetical protein
MFPLRPEMKTMQVRTRITELTFISAVVFAVCTTALAQQVRYNFLQGTDFSKYKTYRWEKLEELEYPTDDVDQKIRHSIDAILTSRGLTRVEEGDSDLLAIYQATVSKQREWNAYRAGADYWDYGGWYGWGGGRPRARTYINVGTLSLDFYDVALKRQVWRGEASKTLNPPKDPMKLQAKIDKAMRRLLKNFPPQSTK